MAVDTNSLAYLIDPFWQGEGINGKPLVAGYMCVYIAGTDQKYITWQNWDGTRHPFKIPLGSDGRATILVEVQYTYDCYLYDSFGNLVCSRLNVKPAIGGDVTVYGLTEVWHDGTMSGEGTPQSPLSVVSAGKVYDGIEPIVVNNIENKISAQHIPLGVQDPLYFVEDSETACIIGCSAQTEIPAELSGKWDEASDTVIANSAQWAEGTEYEAGSYVDIDGHTISVTGLQPEGDYAYNSALSSKLDVTALPQDLVHSGDLTAYYPSDNPSGFITGVDLTDYATTAQLDEKLDKSDSGNFYPMEGNPSGFLTAHQSLQGYATEQWVENKGYLTGVDIPESATWNATTETVSSNSAQWGASNPQIPVTGINGIKISESGDKVVFEVSGDYATHDDLTSKQDSLTFGYKDTAISSIDNSALYDNSAHARITTLAGRISDLSSNKLDTTAFYDVSGNFVTNTQLQNVSADITAMIPTALTGEYVAGNNESGFAIASNSGSIAVGENEYLGSQAIGIVKSTSGIWLSPNQLEIYGNGVDETINANDISALKQLSSNKLDTTAFSDVSGNFLTAVDIPQSATWNEVSTTVQSNSAQWAEGGTTYTSPSGTIRIAGDTLEGTTSAVVGDSITDVVDNGDVTQWMVLTALPNYPYGEYLLRRSDLEPDHEIFCVYGNWNYTYYEHPPVNETFSVPLVREGYPLTQIQSNGSLSAIKDNKQVVELALKSDLVNYQLTSDMTAYQPVGSYLTTADSANFYTTANESGYLTAVPDTYLQNTDLSTEDGKVTAISGIPLSAGGDVPEGVMVESGLEYNAVNEISGYNGSAIAQYGAEKQFIVHDDTLVHLSNSAQYALGVNVSALQRLMGIDETVLFFAGNESSGVQSGNLTESIKNFKRIRVAGMDNDGHVDVKYIYPAWTKNADGFSTSGYEVFLYGANPYAPQSTVWEKWTRYSFSALTSFNVVLSYEGSYTANSVNNVTNNHKNSIREVVGIGRISG